MRTIGESAKLAVGPANFAEQATLWAEAVDRLVESVEAWSFSYTDWPIGFLKSQSFRFRSDVKLPHPKIPLHAGRGVFLERALNGASHVALDGFLGLRGKNPMAGLTIGDIEYASRKDRRVALIAHGSDVRDPSAHMERHAFSYFRSADRDWVEYFERQSRKNRELSRVAGLPTYVSTPDLLLDMPAAKWLPLTIDIDNYIPCGPKTENRKLRVLHAPTRTRPAIKGSELIDPVLRRIAEEGLIEYIRPVRSSHAEFIDLMYTCDIVVDQILSGCYGATSIEAMALGKVVVANISPQVWSVIGECPIVSLGPDDFESGLRQLIASPETLTGIGQQSRSFVTRWHDGRAAAVSLEKFVRS